MKNILLPLIVAVLLVISTIYVGVAYLVAGSGGITGKYSIREDDGHFEEGEFIRLEPEGALYMDICKSHPDSERGFVRQSCGARNGIWNLEEHRLTLNPYAAEFNCKVYTASLSFKYNNGKLLPDRSIVCEPFPGTSCPALDDEGNRIGTSSCSGGIWTLVSR